MPGLGKAFLNQKAVYLRATGKDPYGKRLVVAAVEIDCRWETRVEQVQDPNGNFIQSSDVVYTKIDIVEGSLMWLGELKDFVQPYSGLIREVLKFRKIPDLKGRRFRRVSHLVRATDQIPNIVS